MLAGCGTSPDGTVTCSTAGLDLALTLSAADGDDEVRAIGFRRPVLFGGDGADTLAAIGDGSQLDGGSGDDTLLGSAGFDIVDGGPGADRIDGGAGDDQLSGDGVSGVSVPTAPPAAPAMTSASGSAPAAPLSSDRIEGGPGRDTVEYDRSAGVTVDLRAGSGGAPGEGDVLSGIESASGGGGSDVLIGDDGPNGLSGGSGGDDVIDGRGGDDTLSGSGPSARVVGGDGDDQIYGDAGEVDAGRGDDRIADATGRVQCGDGRDVVETPQRRATVGADCEAVEAGNFAVRDLRRDGRRLRLTVRDVLGLQDRECGAMVALRAVTGDRVLARGFVRLAGARPRRATLTAPRRPLPPRLRIALRIAVCHPGKPPRAAAFADVDGFIAEPLTGRR
ncbi:hypothetical protein [Conexibacter sp. CPCC 206217]|uniref:calcium-binding protein n=1 Tax=Conexibacter sp. CPCC 206217 TaxID=3064574 RepID=UPI002726992E|nr:hypothetical protein [Conexibacter sp. CPCC 206217]MDO8213229.1 hypothetical protein [Conexibacter sp. CPCC 206217]